LFSCKWFLRIWVVQEVVLAKETIVIIGKEKLEWAPLGRTAIRVTNHRSPYQTLLPRQIVQACLQATAIDVLKTIPYGKFKNMENLVQSFSAEATDPRDKIYGLLGISEGQHGRPKPNYMDSVLDVYTNWTRHFISRSQTLGIFSKTLVAGFCFGDEGSRSSWIPYRYEEPISFVLNKGFELETSGKLS
jgi:hypothetical protein